MPVKNIKRRTNDGLEGVITGLNDKEKEIISNSVGIEANPDDEATKTLTKLKVGDTTYDFNKRLEKNGTFVQNEGGVIINSVTFTDEEVTKVKNGEVDKIFGTYYENETDIRTYSCDYSLVIDQGEEPTYVFVSSNATVENNILTTITSQVTMTGNNGFIVVLENSMPVTPMLPSDASEKTLSLVSTNGSIAWEEFSGGVSQNVILIDKPEDVVGHINEPGVFGMKYYRENRYSYLIGTINSRSGDNIWLDGLLVRIQFTSSGDRNFYAGIMENKSCQFVNSGFFFEFSKPLAFSSNLDRYNHCVSLKDSTGNILFTAMMRNTKNTVCNSYSTLHSLFGNGVYSGNGSYAQLDLTGGTEANDKLIKLDGTEATLDTLETITYADKVFLSK